MHPDPVDCGLVFENESVQCLLLGQFGRPNCTKVQSLQLIPKLNTTMTAEIERILETNQLDLQWFPLWRSDDNQCAPLGSNRCKTERRLRRENEKQMKICIDYRMHQYRCHDKLGNLILTQFGTYHKCLLMM
ncbi:hypothetical protein NQ317_003265 [Molorchus minor]|uniref:Uncharacterized protein n=1 Tax=Molorchus minor TaxID=1323400 RepID=A0ABQ9JLG1_9CUCU|nr:hypothetical protein NQ317_003265 [Molorchus minor]